MPQTNAEQAEQLAKNSPDCSFLLTHLIRKSPSEAQNTLGMILDLLPSISGSPQPKLIGGNKSYYGIAEANVFVPGTATFKLGSTNTKAVCFTESTLAGLKAHRDLFGAKYGLAFDRDDLFSKGAAPCINIPHSLMHQEMWDNHGYTRRVYNYIPEQLHPFVNIINESFNATHEREWRVAGDLEFSWSDVRFIFCPEEDFSHFSQIQVNGLPTLFDLEWLDRI